MEFISRSLLQDTRISLPAYNTYNIPRLIPLNKHSSSDTFPSLVLMRNRFSPALPADSLPAFSCFVINMYEEILIPASLSGSPTSPPVYCFKTSPLSGELKINGPDPALCQLSSCRIDSIATECFYIYQPHLIRNLTSQ